MSYADDMIYADLDARMRGWDSDEMYEEQYVGMPRKRGVPAHVQERRKQALLATPEETRREEYWKWVKKGERLGYKPGWAAWNYKTTYGEWPKSEWGKARPTKSKTAKKDKSK